MSRQRLARRFDIRSRRGFEREIKIPKDWTPRELGAGSLLLWLRADRGYALNGMSAVTSTGTSPPVMAISAGSPLVPTDLRIEVVGTGTLGVATYRASLDGGNTWLPTAATAASVSIGPFTVTQAAGTYSANNVWVAGSRYSQLDDFSGNGNHVTQASSGLQPTAKCKSGRVSLSFDSVAGQFMQTASGLAVPASFSIYVCVEQKTVAVQQWICGCNGPTTSRIGTWATLRGLNDGHIEYSFSNGVATATSYKTASSTPLVGAVSFVTGYQSGDDRHNLNYQRLAAGSEIAPAMSLTTAGVSTSLGSTAYKFGVGCLGEYTAAETWAGTIREIVIVNRRLSLADAKRLCAYARSQNGV